jgi:hypothetical protein
MLDGFGGYYSISITRPLLGRSGPYLFVIGNIFYSPRMIIIIYP